MRGFLLFRHENKYQLMLRRTLRLPELCAAPIAIGAKCMSCTETFMATLAKKNKYACNAFIKIGFIEIKTYEI